MATRGGAPVALPPLLEVLKRLGAQLHRARAAARIAAAGLGCGGLRPGAAVLRPAKPQVLQLRQRRALPGAGRAITCAGSLHWSRHQAAQCSANLHWQRVQLQ
jgi:hypothetical protein